MTTPAPRVRHHRKKQTRRRRLPMRYMLPFLFLVALLAMLMLRGYVHSGILADHRIQPPAATDRVPEQVLGAARSSTRAAPPSPPRRCGSPTAGSC